MLDATGVAGVFREEWPKVVATLVRDLGDVELAEDCAQEAFLEAAARWTSDDRPDRPGGWIITTARRKAIDRIRRDDRFRDLVPALTELVEREPPSTSGLVDEQLALLLGCCHPALGLDAQVALTLRIVAGLSTAQIARAFLVSESTMTRRLSRAKTKIRAARIPFGPVDRTVLDERLAAVSGVVYLIFTEGHASASAASLVRGELIDEALWLAALLAELAPDDAEVAGLHALMLLTDARRAGRLDDHGRLVMLEDQDRSRWDHGKVARGLAELARAQARADLGPYQLQAAIAALHSTAPSFDATRWSAIVTIYDEVMAHFPSPVVALNRALAVSYAEGPDAGLAAIEAIDHGGELDTYPYLHAGRAELLARLGRSAEAIASYDEALRLTTNDSERAHLERRRARAGD